MQNGQTGKRRHTELITSLTIALYDYSSQDELEACLDALRLQTFSDFELLIQSPEEDSVEFRNKAIREAKGDYLAFLPASARYAYPQALEKMVLTAQLEDAPIVLGKTSRYNGRLKGFSNKLPWDKEGFLAVGEDALNGTGLSSVILSCSFLRQHNLRFNDFGVADEERFLTQTAQIAKRVYSIGREISCVHETFSLAPIDKATRTTPLVSFVIPIYNAGALVSRCISSILSIPVRNLEVICIDDGSTDDSLAVLQGLAKHDGRIKVLTQENAGQGAARNRGIQLAKGRFIQFVDADDYIDSSMYPAVLAPFFKYPDLDFVQFSGEVTFDFEPTQQQKDWGSRIFKTSLASGFHERGLDLLVSTIVVNKVYTREFLQGNEILFPERTKQEDEAFSFFVFARAKQMFFINKPWYKYVRTQTGTMSSQESGAQLSVIPDCYRIFRFIGEFLKNEPHSWLLGYYFKRVIGATTRFNDTPIEEKCRDYAAELLRANDFGLLNELMVATDSAKWLQDLGHEFFGRSSAQSDLLTSPLPAWRMPPLKESWARSSRPKLSYIVLIDGCEQVAVAALQSLADQTFGDIEIICVAASTNGAAARLVDYFRRSDGRFCLHTVDGGVLIGNAPDFAAQIRDALSVARGEYVSILFGEDYVSLNHAQTCVDAMAGQDIILVPETYFDANTHAPVKQGWGNRSARRMWNLGNRGKQSVCPDNCNHVYRLDFLRENREAEPVLQRGFVTAWLFHKLVQAKNLSVAKGAVCHIRQGKLNSIFPATHEEWLERCACLLRSLMRVLASSAVASRPLPQRKKCMGFAFEKIFWLVERDIELSTVLKEELDAIPTSTAKYLFGERNEFLARAMSLAERSPASVKNDLPQRYVEAFEKIDAARKEITPDTIVVISFLLDASAECIDSWNLFAYLREQGQPAKYVIPKGCRYYGEVVARSKWRSDVIVLEGSDLGSSYEIADRLMPVLYRVKAIVMEDGYLPAGLAEQLKQMSKLLLVFLDHGSFYIWFNKAASRMFSRFHIVNVSGELERRMIQDWHAENHVKQTFDFVEAGCPRYDFLPSESHESEKMILVSLTWRPELNSLDKLKRSYYFKRLTELLNSLQMDSFRGQGVKVALVVHHAMRRTLGDVDLDQELCPNGGVLVVGSSEVSHYLQKASCLVTDMSSVAFDFLYQKKPVVFWLPDADDYELSCISRTKLDCAQRQLARFGYAKSVKEAVAQIEDQVAHGFHISKVESDFSDEFFAHRGAVRQDLLAGINHLWSAKFGQPEEDQK